MIITYFRSSSLANWKFCELQYYMTYVLGFSRDAGKKAELGTIVHKVLEILAIAKCEHDKTGEKIITIKEPSGEYVIDTEVWLKPHHHTFETAEAINKTRINKSKYKSECRLPANHIQYGKEFLDAITVRVFNYYKSKSKHEYENIDLVDVKNWVWMAVDFQNGIYDPRKRNIVAPEQSFDFEIKRKWSKYSYELDGKKIKGNLAIKGTIDLVTDIGDGVYEIVDWKTGQRLDWATGEVKDYDKLKKDPQLMLYYYAARHIFPEAKAIMLTIFFVRDGGPFTICFDDSTLLEVERHLEKQMKEIANSEKPQMLDPKQRDFRCQKLCDYYKTSMDGTNTCLAVKNKIQLLGIGRATAELKNPNFEFGQYQAPGGE
jgi:ATP-dependent helicase/DNAse subunit B